MLAYLVLQAGRLVSGDRLIDELWGDDPPETARKSLQVRIAGLRKALGAAAVSPVRPATLCTSSGTRSISSDSRISSVPRRDRHRPRRRRSLEQALALWRGPPLADFQSEPWARAAGARIEELRLVAFEHRCDAYLSSDGITR